MQRVRVDGVELEYQAEGTGESVVLIHGGVLADGLSPLACEPALAEHHRIISYHRVGSAGSSKAQRDVEIADQAVHCRALLDHLEVEQAHVVGHSSGAMIALQLAHDAPQHVATLALLELPDFQQPGSADSPRPGWPRRSSVTAVATRPVPWMPSCVASADQAPGRRPSAPCQRGPSIGRRWTPTRSSQWKRRPPSAGGSRRQRPGSLRLYWWSMGALSPEVHRVYTEAHDAMLNRFPQAEPYLLPEAAHMLALDNPADLAAALANFIGRHPLNGQS